MGWLLGRILINARRLRIGTGIVLAGFILALIFGASGLLGGGPALGAATSVTVIGGSVSVRHGVGGSFVAAVDGEILTSGDAIQTGDDGRAVLTYFEGSTVTIEPSSELSIDEAAAQSGATKISMTQNFGRTWHVVTHLVSGESKYEVRTPASTASVRGTEFQVNNDARTTTVTTTEGTVLDKVPDPVNPTQTVDVPVTAGQEHTQPKNEAPAPLHPAPEPERKVTVTVSASNSLIVDPLGRTNGITPDGRVIVQTPGAQVTRDGDKIVIKLPDIPDGKIGASVDRSKDNDKSDVNVQTLIEQKDGKKTELTFTAAVGENKNATSGIEVKKQSDGSSGSRVLTEDEQKSVAKSKVGELPKGNVSGNRAGDQGQGKSEDTKGSSGSTGADRPPLPPTVGGNDQNGGKTDNNADTSNDNADKSKPGDAGASGATGASGADETSGEKNKDKGSSDENNSSGGNQDQPRGGGQPPVIAPPRGGDQSPVITPPRGGDQSTPVHPPATGDQKPPSDAKPPVDQKPPTEQKPPSDAKPPVDQKPPTEQKPPSDAKPPKDEKPPVTPPNDSDTGHGGGFVPDTRIHLPGRG